MSNVNQLVPHPAATDASNMQQRNAMSSVQQQINTMQPSSAMANLQATANALNKMQQGSTMDNYQATANAMANSQQQTSNFMASMQPAGNAMTTFYPTNQMANMCPGNAAANMLQGNPMTNSVQPVGNTIIGRQPLNAMFSMQNLIKGGGNMFMSSDDNVMMRQIYDTHTPDGRGINVKPLFHIVEDIMASSHMSIPLDAANSHVMLYTAICTVNLHAHY